MILVAAVIILTMLFLFTTGCTFKYFIHTARLKEERDTAYFVLAKKIGEDEAITEIATVHLDSRGFEEREILENNMLEEEKERVRSDITNAVDDRRKYA